MPRSTKPRNTKRAKMTFDKKVLQVIRKQAETKMKVVTIFDNSAIQGAGLQPALSGGAGGLFNSNILGQMALAQGTEQEQRVGNQVSNCRITLRGFVDANAYNATTNTSSNPFEVHMVIFKSKDNYQTDGDLDGIKLQKLKSLPSNSLGPVDGSVKSTIYPYNKDLYIIKKVRIFRLKANPQDSNPNQVNPQVNGSWDQRYRRFKMDIPISKTLKYVDGVSNTPTNDWFSIGWFIVDGGANTIAQNQVRAHVSMDAVLKFEDL